MQTVDSIPRKAAPSYKIIVLGESNVGKSSLFLRYTLDIFRDAMANTIGIDNSFKELIIDGSPVHLQLWDTAGQERFRSIVTAYYRESDGFVFVYDVTVEYMVQRIEEMTDCIDPRFTVVVGNKIDSIGKDKLEEEKMRLSLVAKKYNFKSYFSSAKTGENVNELFEELGRNLYYNKTKKENSTNLIDLSKKKKKHRWCFK